MIRLRACWLVHSPVGYSVTPRMRMRRAACSITVRTWAWVPPGRSTLRNTNRRHVIGDHHGESAGRATRLVSAVDAILDTDNAQCV